MRFSLIDRILALENGQSITAIKQLSSAEEYLADHFPGFPIMPGVLMLEAMTQASAWLMRSTTDFRFSTVMLKQSRAVKFNSFVTPGNTLKIVAQVMEWGDRYCTFKCNGTVNGVSTVSARLKLEQFNLADTNSELATCDERTIQMLRDQFTSLKSQMNDTVASTT
ncbi:MAG: beta-hydroxyacyl-ACP dehydratase [Planctomycetota bacterium]|nr:beta-hydroxyacyl-ACP dehydratase [Planctomycetota bacterium]MDA1213768.1 beta-hydroxyacyl-ACP dehydratase [Planctomycetota bacterium]